MMHMLHVKILRILHVRTVCMLYVKSAVASWPVGVTHTGPVNDHVLGMWGSGVAVWQPLSKVCHVAASPSVGEHLCGKHYQEDRVRSW